MIQAIETKDSYLALCESAVDARRAAAEPAWLGSIRRSAADRFRALGFPTTRDDEWRYTNVSRIADTPFEIAVHNDSALAFERIARFALTDVTACRLTFVNGRFDAGLSRLDGLPDGVTVCNLAAAMDTHAPLLESHLAQHADRDEQAFVALNTALFEDGAFVHVPKGVVVEAPIHILFVTTPQTPAAMTNARVLIVTEANSRVTIVESYVGVDSGACFTNTVTEIVAGEDSAIDHYKLERENDDAYHIATLQVDHQRGSDVASHCISLGGSLVRNDINALLDGEGCECTLNGLYLADGTQHIDNHLRVDHAKPHCNSREFFKGILAGKGRGVFSGKIMVRKDAQKTDAKQSNKSLLLSPDALVESKPQLEILADDVKCTHGATIGQVDEEQMFYLRTRGLSMDAARTLLVYAFAREIIAGVRIPALRTVLDELVLAKLPQGCSLDVAE